MRRIALLAGAVALVGSGAGAYETIDVKNGGIVVGVVSYDGPRPAVRTLSVTKDQEVCGTQKVDPSLVVSQDNKLADAIVSIAVTRGKPMAEGSAELDQKGCQYAPHVLLVPSGATIKVLNGDGILHNVHTYGRANPPVNIAQPSFKKEVSIQLDEVESVPVKCDTHEWMSGVIVVADHPYYAKTDASGSFRLTDVPPGEHVVKVWHEKLGEKTARVKVAPGKEARVDFTLGAR
jgi:plastocyanin